LKKFVKKFSFFILTPIKCQLLSIITHQDSFFNRFSSFFKRKKLHALISLFL
jgi:hypothetical protein